MDQKDRLKGHVRVLSDGSGLHGRELSGDVPAYISIDSIGQLVMSNAVASRRRKAERLQALGIQAGCYSIGFLALALVSLFTFGGCDSRPSPSTQYRQHQSW